MHIALRFRDCPYRSSYVLHSRARSLPIRSLGVDNMRLRHVVIRVRTEALRRSTVGHARVAHLHRLGPHFGGCRMSIDAALQLRTILKREPRSNHVSVDYARSSYNDLLVSGDIPFDMSFD